MKRNVDLTTNRMFSRQFQIPSIAMFDFEPFHFWDYETMQPLDSDQDLSGYKSSIVLLGNATERQAQRAMISLDNGHVCECCGASLDTKPWNKHFGLCARCADHLDISCQKLWKYRDDPIQESRDRVVIEMNRR